MKKLSIILGAIVFLASNSYSQSEVVECETKKLSKEIPSESELLTDFVDRHEKKSQQYSKKVLKFMLDKVINLRVDTVIVRFPKKFGGSSIGYSLIAPERAKRRQKELERQIAIDRAKPNIITRESRTSIVVR